MCGRSACYLTLIPAVHKGNTTANTAILNEMIGENEAIINPILAAKLNIKNGQMVRIRSRVGQIELKGKFSEAVRDDAVMVYHGFGHCSRLLTRAHGKVFREGDVIPEGKIDLFVATKNCGVPSPTPRHCNRSPATTPRPLRAAVFQQPTPPVPTRWRPARAPSFLGGVSTSSAGPFVRFHAHGKL